MKPLSKELQGYKSPFQAIECNNMVWDNVIHGVLSKVQSGLFYNGNRVQAVRPSYHPEILNLETMILTYLEELYGTHQHKAMV